MKCVGCKKEVERINEHNMCIECHDLTVKATMDMFEYITGEKPPVMNIPFEGSNEYFKGVENNIKEGRKKGLKKVFGENIPNIDKVDLFLDTLALMAKTYNDKNHDYGDSFGKQFKKFGLHSSVIRLNDKLSRLESLVDKENKVKDESVMDTLLDMASYCVMTIVELRMKNDK